MTHTQIIELFGRTELAMKISTRLGVTYRDIYQRVGKWRDRNRIPQDYFQFIVELAREADLPITYTILAEASRGRNEPKC